MEVWIKGKVEQSRESGAIQGVVAIEKGAFGSPSTKVANVLLIIYLFRFTKTYTITVNNITTFVS